MCNKRSDSLNVGLNDCKWFLGEFNM